jgi:transcriptional regulator with XRE-family HTH domain
MPHSVHRQFAENLFRLTTRSGSIAEVCRQTNINRQQFNKYLAGVNLPNEKVMSTLASYFGVTEHALVEPEELSRNVCPAPPLMGRIKSASSEVTMPEGFYSVYTLWPADSRMVLRFIVVIRRQGAFTYFTRLGRFAREHGGLNLGRLMRMEGVVIQSGSQVMLVGQEEKHWTEFFSTVCLSALNRPAEEIWPGLTLTFTPAGVPTATRVVVQKEARSANIRVLLRQTGLARLDQLGPDSKVKCLLSDSQSHLNCVDVFATQA